MKLKKSILTGFMVLLILCSAGDASQQKNDDMPLALRVVLNNAYKHFDKQEYKKAIETLDGFRAGGKNGSDHYLIDFYLGTGWLHMNNPSRALPFFESAVAKNKDFSPAWLNLARCRYDLSQFKKAAEAFEKGYETSSPKQGETLYYAAATWFSDGNVSKTVEVMERLFKNHPEEIKPEWKETLVHAYLAVKKPEKALVLMEQLVNLFTGEKKLQWQEAILYQYLSMNMQKKALGIAEQLSETHPLEPKWWKALAHIHLAMDRHREALAAMIIYSYLHPLDEKEKKLMAELSLMAGVPSKAVTYYESLHAQSSQSDIVIKIVQSYQMMNQPQQALKWVEKGLLQTKSPELMMQKATLLYELRQYDKSIEAFESFINEKKGDIGLAWLMIGFAASQDNKLDKAMIAFENASKFESHQKTALSHLEQIKNFKRSELQFAQ
jgi:tetratricopeptide (TPR) repeat protein